MPKDITLEYRDNAEKEFFKNINFDIDKSVIYYQVS